MILKLITLFFCSVFYFAGLAQKPDTVFVKTKSSGTQQTETQVAGKQTETQVGSKQTKAQTKIQADTQTPTAETQTQTGVQTKTKTQTVIQTKALTKTKASAKQTATQTQTQVANTQTATAGTQTKAEAKVLSSKKAETQTVLTNQKNFKKQSPLQSESSLESTKLKQEVRQILSPESEQSSSKTLNNSSLDREISSGEFTQNNKFFELGLEYPMSFGVHFRYLFDDSFYARLGLGFLPRFFLSTFKEISPNFGYLSEEEALLMANSFENSVYLDLRFAWSPALKTKGSGPYLELGLSGIVYGKGTLEGDNLSKALDSNLFPETRYSAQVNTYNFTVHAGYQIPIDSVKLNIEVGLIKILSANVKSEADDVEHQAFNTKQTDRYKKFLMDKGWIFPTLSAWISIPF